MVCLNGERHFTIHASIFCTDLLLNEQTFGQIEMMNTSNSTQRQFPSIEPKHKRIQTKKKKTFWKSKKESEEERYRERKKGKFANRHFSHYDPPHHTTPTNINSTLDSLIQWVKWWKFLSPRYRWYSKFEHRNLMNFVPLSQIAR